MREVLGFSAREVADSLDETVASVNSALQRARKSVDERLPERTQQATLRALGDERLREIVEGYTDAMQRGDVDAVVDMLAEEAAWSMPPLATWYSGLDSIRVFLGEAPLPAGGAGAPGRHTTASRRRRLHLRLEIRACYLPFALDVLTSRRSHQGDRVVSITRTAEGGDREFFARYPDQALEPRKVVEVFERFGLPARLD